MKLLSRTFTFCLALLSVLTLSAQSNRTGTWNILSVKLNLDKKWSLFNEDQLRSQLFFDDFSYYEIKGGANYTFNKYFSVLAGMGWHVTYSNGDNFKKPFINKEWRIYEQFATNTYLGRVRLENRYRIEQRWLANGGYRNRFRCRLNAFVLINGADPKPGLFYLTAGDEVLLTNVTPYFEGNRLYAGSGYEVTKHLALQLANVYQFNYLSNKYAGKYYIQLTFIVEANAYKPGRTGTDPIHD